MAWFIAICFAAAAIACTFAYPLLGWSILALPEMFLSWTGFSAFSRRYRDIPGLSDGAQVLFHRYAHYYHTPFACSDLGSASGYLGLAGIGLTVISLFKSCWLAAGIGLPNTFLMVWLSWRFDPRGYIQEPIHKLAHDEIMAHLFPEPKEHNKQAGIDC